MMVAGTAITLHRRHTTATPVRTLTLTLTLVLILTLILALVWTIILV